jgi:hypothetical protein
MPSGAPRLHISISFGINEFTIYMAAAGSERLRCPPAREPDCSCSPTHRFDRRTSGDFRGFCGRRRFALRCAGHRRRRHRVARVFSRRSEKRRCTAPFSAIRKSCNRCNKHTKPAVSPSASLPRCSISTRGRCRSPGPAMRRSVPPCRLTTFPPDTGVDPSVHRMPSPRMRGRRPASDPRHSSFVRRSTRLRAGRHSTNICW